MDVFHSSVKEDEKTYNFWEESYNRRGLGKIQGKEYRIGASTQSKSVGEAMCLWVGS